MSALEDELKIVRASNPAWSFEECFSHLEKTRPSLFSSTIEMNRVRALARPGVELAKAQEQARIEARARQLMSRNPRLTFGMALSDARFDLRLEAAHASGLLAPKKPETDERAQRVEGIEELKWPAGKTRLLIRGSEAVFMD